MVLVFFFGFIFGVTFLVSWRIVLDNTYFDFIYLTLYFHVRDILDPYTVMEKCSKNQNKRHTFLVLLICFPPEMYYLGCETINRFYWY